MLYRKMPKVKEELSILGFGAMRLPVIDNVLANINEPEATKMIRTAIDSGVNYIDTAYPYHGTGMGSAGNSEPLVGKALKDGYREKVQLATKLPSWQVENPEDMGRLLNHQLERLEVDTIDFYLLHALNNKHWEKYQKFGYAEFLNKAKADGKIKYAGFSFHHDSVDLFKEIVDAYDWEFCQIQYNYLDVEYQAGLEGLGYASEKGLGIIIMEPLKGGSLVNDLPEKAQEAFKQADPNKNNVDWALRWLWNQEKVHVVLSGMSAMEHVVDNIRIAEKAEANSLSAAELETIAKVKKIIEDKVSVNCTACGYCMPCPHGVNIPENFTYYNTYQRFDTPGVKMNTKIMYANIVPDAAKAKSCIECGECLSHCPQSIPIPEKLKEVAEAMG